MLRYDCMTIVCQQNGEVMEKRNRGKGAPLIHTRGTVGTKYSNTAPFFEGVLHQVHSDGLPERDSLFTGQEMPRTAQKQTRLK